MAQLRAEGFAIVEGYNAMMYELWALEERLGVVEVARDQQESPEGVREGDERDPTEST